NRAGTDVTIFSIVSLNQSSIGSAPAALKFVVILSQQGINLPQRGWSSLRTSCSLSHAMRIKELETVCDPYIHYFALLLLILMVVVLFYGISAIHDIPAKTAESRHHPHQDAIHAAGWVSLFTLHVLWPFLWIWAMTYRPDRGWGFSPRSAGAGAEPAAAV